ncbi:hypothetical protein P3565_22690, partial [Vibrio parahaemolyticus]|nr:hypothetical protein [Vibrio parahaemolyticus]
METQPDLINKTNEFTSLSANHKQPQHQIGSIYSASVILEKSKEKKQSETAREKERARADKRNTTLIYNCGDLLPGYLCIISPWRSARSSVYSDTASRPPGPKHQFPPEVWPSDAAALFRYGELSKLSLHLRVAHLRARRGAHLIGVMCVKPTPRLLSSLFPPSVQLALILATLLTKNDRKLLQSLTEKTGTAGGWEQTRLFIVSKTTLGFRLLEEM